MPYEVLLVLAIVSAISGIALVILSAVRRVSRPSTSSRLRDRSPVTIYGAMRSGIALPTWWKWWYSGIPVVVLTIVEAEAHFSAPIYWSLVLGYAGAWMAYVYFVSKKWVEGKA